MPRPIKTLSSPDYRTKICVVAEALFAERGFDGTSTREIAQHTGSTKALIYHYYRNKEALYLSLLETAVSAVVTQIEEIAARDGSPEEKIRLVVQVFLDQYGAHPQSFQMVQRAIDEHSPTAATLAERWFSRAHLALQDIAEEGIRQGVFKPLPPQQIPFVIVGLIIHALRGHKLTDRINPTFSGAYLLNTLADLILTLLKTDKASNPQRRLPTVRLRRSGSRVKRQAGR